MVDGMMTVIAFLSLGYLLFAVEMVVPGGVLGILGLSSVLYGCWQAFQLGFIWGTSSILASLIFFFVMMRFFLHSRTGKRLTLANEEEARSWKSNREDWKELLGKQGVAMSPLRPAGVISIDGTRYDVVSDNEFLEIDQTVKVVEVEGRRIVVEPVESSDIGVPTDTTSDKSVNASLTSNGE